MTADHPTARALFALDHLPIGALALTANGTVAFWNRCLEDWTGIARSAIVGVPIESRYPRFALPLYQDRIRQVFEAGAPTIFSPELHSPLLPSRAIPRTIVTGGQSGHHRLPVRIDVVRKQPAHRFDREIMGRIALRRPCCLAYTTKWNPSWQCPDSRLSPSAYVATTP